MWNKVSCPRKQHNTMQRPSLESMTLISFERKSDGRTTITARLQTQLHSIIWYNDEKLSYFLGN